MANKPDEAHRLTDKELEALERRISAEYGKAAKELQEKIDDYFAKFEKRDAELKKQLDAGEITEDYYKQWRLAQIGRGKRFEALRDRIADRMTKANETAAAYINDETAGIYSLNRNYAAYTIESVAGDVGFDMWDEQTVKRLIKEQPDLMPYYPPERAVKRGIDLKWGKQQITAQVTSGILQGESIKHLSDRLQKNIPDMNRTSAIRAARTAVTGAQNAGRIDSYEAAKGMGIKLKKQWLATLDGRTRHSHAVLDGEQVENDKKFSNGCMFPGDPNGPPSEIYNCRCSIVAAVDGVDTSDAKRWARDPETGEAKLIEDMTYSEWAGWKKKVIQNEAKFDKAYQDMISQRRAQYHARASAAKKTSALPDFDGMSKEQLYSYAEKELKTGFDSFSGVNQDFARETIKVIAQFEQKAGGKTIPGLSVKFGGLPQQVAAKYDDKTHTLILKKSGSLKGFNESSAKIDARSMFKLGKPYYADSTYAGTVWHELGHAVDISTGQALSRALSANEEIFASSAGISVYAASSQGIRVTRRSEAWAENFSAYMGKGKNAGKVPEDIVSMIEQYFEDMRRK